MGQAESADATIQQKLEKSGPTFFVEDMSPEEKANYYKTVLNVN